MNHPLVESITNETVVLVDSKDNQLGTMDKFEAHLGAGTLHRAISVLLFDSEDRWLLQQRAADKPLWPLFWSNTVCTHPRDGESYLGCARRRLSEELGIQTASNLRVIDRIEYQASYNQALSEHELDTVIVGEFSGQPQPNPKEVAASRWVDTNTLTQELTSNPDIFTPWFKIIFQSFNSKSG